MTIIIGLISYGLDLFVLIYFMEKMLRERKPGVFRRFLIPACLLVELLIFLGSILAENNLSSLSPFAMIFISLSTTFALSFFYETSIRHRIFMTFFFQILVLFGEFLFSMLTQAVIPSILEQPGMFLNEFMNFGSKITFFLLVAASVSIWNKNLRSRQIQYNLLLFSTPTITLVIMASTPLTVFREGKGSNFFLLLYSALAILNITNCILLDSLVSMTEMKHKIENTERQVEFQKNKYIQLGTAYKTNRRIIHDVKKHYFIIDEYLKNKNYSALKEYIGTAISNIEHTYIGVNTGNLVVDSFVGNYTNVAESNSIRFNHDIEIDPDRLPINDYELCVILGNLLDNSLNACMKSRVEQRPFVSLGISTARQNTLCIQTSNTYLDEKNSTEGEVNFEHGYGLRNIEEIVKQHDGLLQITQKDSVFRVAIAIPIL